jgi:hypothetical protein
MSLTNSITQISLSRIDDEIENAEHFLNDIIHRVIGPSAPRDLIQRVEETMSDICADARDSIRREVNLLAASLLTDN